MKRKLDRLKNNRYICGMFSFKGLCIAAALMLTIIVSMWARSGSPDYEQWIDAPPEQLLEKAYSYHQANRQDSALYFYRLLGQRFSHKDSPTAEEKNYMAKGYSMSGFLYMFVYCNYSQALQCLLKAEILTSDPKTMVETTHFLSNLYLLYDMCYPSAENRHRAETYLKKSYDIAEKEKDTLTMIDVFPNLWTYGLDSTQFSRYSEEIRSFDRIRLDPSNPIQAYVAKTREAVRKARAGDIDGAAQDFLQQLDIKSELQEDMDIMRCQTFLCLVTLYESCGDRENEMKYLKELVKAADRANLKDFKMEAYHKLLGHAQASGDTALSDSYQLKFYKTRDSLMTMYKMDNMKNPGLLKELEDMNGVVHGLRHKQKVQRYIIAAAITGVIIALIVVILMVHNYRRVHRVNRTLYEKNVSILEAEKRERELRQSLEKKLETHVILTEPDVKPEKYASSSLEEEEKNKLADKIIDIMNTSPEIFSDSFTLTRLAELCDASYKHTSQVVNERFEQGFVTLISEYRVKEACRRINDVEGSRSFTLEAIGNSVGFKTRSGFFRAFKRVTGTTPSKFQAMAREAYSENSVS